MRHEAELRAFVRACLPWAAEVDEVMQEVSLVAWRKFAALEDKAQFARWACVIARYEVLKHRRAHARDRLVLDEDIIEQLAAEAEEETPRRSRQLGAALTHQPPPAKLDALPAPEGEVRASKVLQRIDSGAA